VASLLPAGRAFEREGRLPAQVGQRRLEEHQHLGDVGERELRETIGELAKFGDGGIVVPDPEDASRVTVAFAATDGAERYVSPARLPAHETVYALTMHKSQGSAFDRVPCCCRGNRRAW
jgi:hypothetical protein